MTTEANWVSFLRRGAPFSRMGADELDWLAGRLRRERRPEGHVFLDPGRAPDCLTFVVSGVVRIEAVGEDIPEENRLLAEIVAGECFPLEALHERRPVFSTFRAGSDTECLTLAAADFAELQQRSPLFREFCAERASAFLDSSRRIFQSHFARGTDGAALMASPLGSLRLRRPDTCGPATTVRQALELFDHSGDSAVFVTDAEASPLGVFTLHDLVRRVLRADGNLDAPVSSVMTRDPVTLPPSADGYEAAQAMATHGVRQILVVERGSLVGAVNERDLLASRHLALGELSGRIRHADSVPRLGILAEDVRRLAERLMAQGIASEPLTRIISSLNDRLAHRVIELGVAMEKETLPDFCWIALGSEGRHEQTMFTDQDNGIIFAGAHDAAAIRDRLLPLARRINDGLDACGFPLCKGDVMAGNPQWCLSLAEWKQRFASWIERPDPEAILNSTIFFDFRPLCGTATLAGELRGWLHTALSGQTRFFHSLSAEALKRAPPIGFFRDFVVDLDPAHPDTLDLKVAAATMFVDAARVLSLHRGVAETSTAGRLRRAAAEMQVPPAEAEAWIDAFHFIQLLRLRRQYELIDAGQPPHNRIHPYKLNDLDRKFLLEALRQAKRLQQRLEVEFAGGRPF